MKNDRVVAKAQYEAAHASNSFVVIGVSAGTTLYQEYGPAERLQRPTNYSGQKGLSESIRNLIGSGELSFTEIAQKLGCSTANVTYHASKIGKQRKRKFYDWPEIQRYYDVGHTPAECIEYFKIQTATIWWNAVRRGDIITRPREKVLRVIRTRQRDSGLRPNSTLIKKKLLSDNLLVYECAICGISDWQGKYISLHLDHINGNPCDNAINNLRLLCPNCHTQTDTFGGRNVGRKHMGL